MIKNYTLLLLFSLPFITLGQFPGCPSIDAGSDQNTTCANPCVNLTATPFETGGTNSYVVNSIPHTPPIAYDEPGGTAVSVNTDDIYSSVIPLPFTFCFYGQNYTDVVVGSNGAISLDVADGGTGHPWELNDPIPSGNLTNAGNIFGVYHDVDPTVNGTVNYYILGSAPCRIFVVSYHELGHFSCTNLRSTFMMVLYETTNAIDVYVEQKETCSGWNGGNAVIGIQNPAGTDGITAPGRNTGSWTASTPEAWRFSPDGAPIYQVEWFENGTSIGTGNTVNVCPSTQTTYTAQATYTACDGSVIVVDDDVVVTPDPNIPSADTISVTNELCNAGDGAFEVDGINGTSPYEYSIDNGTTFQTSGVFSSLTDGSYDVVIEDDSGCQGQVTITVGEDNNLAFDLDSTDVTCAGASDGDITVSPTTGLSPYQYSLNGGAYQGSNTFSNLSIGTYDVTVVDDNGCELTQTIEVGESSGIELALDSTDVTCLGGADGSITGTVTNGSSPYDFSLNGGSTQTSNIFGGLSAGVYTVDVVDDNGCIASESIEVLDGYEVQLNLDSTDVTCAGDSDGSITANASNGTSPYEYSLNSGTPQTTNLFDNLTAGTYDITVTDDNGCTNTETIEVVEPNAVNLSLDNTTDVSCFGETDGIVETSASGGTTPYSYTNNGGTAQGNGNFNNLSAGNYEIVVTDDNGCTDTVNATITEPAEPTTTINYDDTEFCAQGSETVTINGTQGGTFSSTSGLSISSTTGEIDLDNSTPGNYTVTYDFTENGCPYSTTTSVDILSLPQIVMEDTIILCEGETWLASASGADSYTWSDGVSQGDNVQGNVGTEIYYVTGTSSNGCSSTDSVYIITSANPTIDISATPTTGTAPLEVSFVNNTIGADSYYWDFGNGTTTNDNATQLFTNYETSGTYQVVFTASNTQGCQSDTIIFIDVLKLPLTYSIPNVFTPNNDQTNDHFKINAQNVEALEVVILNRWGNVVFESTDVNFEWNGKVHNVGAECTDGTYFYKIKIEGEEGQLGEEHGFIHLVRDSDK